MKNKTAKTIGLITALIQDFTLKLFQLKSNPIPIIYFSKIKTTKAFGLLMLLAFYLIGTVTVKAQTYPAGFVQVQIASNIIAPTVMAFAPDGRIFVAQQDGKLRIIKNGTLLTQPFIALNVNSSGERGLLGIAFDPDFSNNKYIYLYYTLASGANNRVSRFKAAGDLVVAGSEFVIVNLDPLSVATNHNGGSLQFGTDGKLYISVGENANSANAQNLNTNLGKILRYNSNGTIPGDNPFKSGSVQKRSIWIYGMRNPFTMAVNNLTGKIYANDVGNNLWEEINDITSGGLNNGWPLYEGYSNAAGYKSPVYAYAHGSGNEKGCAITGGTFFNPVSTNFPSAYFGNYFFIDLCGKWINRLSFSGSTITHTVFATNLKIAPVGITAGPDGNLYYLSRHDNTLLQIKYVLSNAPVISLQPQSITRSVGNSATFTVSASGTNPLNYQWKKNGINISGANSASYTITAVAPSDAAAYKVVISNTAGSISSTAATLTVTAANNAPVATITTPATGTTYAAGTTISYSGTGTDTEDGTLPASAFTWYVEFHHDMHIHPGPSAPDSVKSNTFDIANSGEISPDVYYRLFLVVIDSKGETDTDFVDIQPRTTTITLNTNPQGLVVTYDGQPFNAPLIETTVEGMQIAIGTYFTQLDSNSITYTFKNWVGGGARIHTITIPVSNTSYTANFVNTLREPDSSANIVNGLNYSYFTGIWNKIPDFETLLPVNTGSVTNFDLSPKTLNSKYGFSFKGYVNIPTDGIYTFYTTSHDGSKLFIGNSLIVDNDSLHAAKEAQGGIGLKAGKHLLTVEFFNRWGNGSLIVSYKGPGITKQLIPDSVLYRAITIQTFKLKPVADSYVRSGTYENFNYGSDSILVSKKAPLSNANQQIYLRFDISALGNNIASAKLKLYGKMQSGLQLTDVLVQHISNVTWDESTITFINKPAADPTILSTVTVSGNNMQYYFWDLTTYINDKKNAGNNYVSILLKNKVETPGSLVIFNAREAADHFPTLLVETESVAKVGSETQASVNLSDVESQFKIYPNPADNYFTVEIPLCMKTCVLQIVNLNGNIENEFTISGSKQIFTNDLNSGAYFIVVKNNYAVFRKRLMIVK